MRYGITSDDSKYQTVAWRSFRFLQLILSGINYRTSTSKTRKKTYKLVFFSFVIFNAVTKYIFCLISFATLQSVCLLRIYYESVFILTCFFLFENYFKINTIRRHNCTRKLTAIASKERNLRLP